MHICIVKEKEMSKIIVNQMNVKMHARVIQVSNHTSTFTLKIDKRQLADSSRKIATALLFLTLGLLLVTTYTSENALFFPLLKVTGIISMVAFIAFKSNKTLKNSRK